MGRVRAVTAAAVLASLVACSEPIPIEEYELPQPSAREAYALSFEVCARAVAEYGPRRVARYLDAAGPSPRQIARAYVRTALDLTDGWETYRRAGLRGCAAGVRTANASRG